MNSKDRSIRKFINSIHKLKKLVLNTEVITYMDYYMFCKNINKRIKYIEDEIGYEKSIIKDEKLSKEKRMKFIGIDG